MKSNNEKELLYLYRRLRYLWEHRFEYTSNNEYEEVKAKIDLLESSQVKYNKEMLYKEATYRVKFHHMLKTASTTSSATFNMNYVDTILTLPVGVNVHQYIYDNYNVVGSVEVEYTPIV